MEREMKRKTKITLRGEAAREFLKGLVESPRVSKSLKKKVRDAQRSRRG